MTSRTCLTPTVIVAMLLTFSSVPLTVSGSSLDLNQLCPYASLCTTGHLKSFAGQSGERPCCFNCSCEDDCFLFGNCCPDKKTTTLAEPAVFPCRTQQDLYSHHMGRDMSSFLALNVNYRVVDGCPAAALRDASLQVAVQRCREPVELQDVVFVSDPLTDRVYLNWHCAACPGVTRGLPWQLHVACDNSAPHTLQPSSNFTQYMLAECSFLSFPPKKHFGQRYMCRKHAKRNCGDVNIFDFFGKELERRCNMYDMPYRTVDGVWYANVYCYLCQHRHEVTVPAACEDIYLELADVRTSIVPFTTIMSFREDTAPLKETTSCASNEIFDPVTLSCVALLCPAGYHASGGNCVSLFDAVYGFGVTIQLGVRLADIPQPQSPHDWWTLAEAVKTHWGRSFHALGLTCGLASLHCYELNDGDALVKLYMYSTKQCKHLDLLSAIAAVVNDSHVPLKLHNHSVVLSSYLISDATSVIRRSEMAQQFKLLIHAIVFTNETVYCPCIEYSISDIYNTSHAETILEHASQVDASTYRVCISKLPNMRTRSEGLLGENSTSANIGVSGWVFGMTVILALVSRA